MSSDVVRFRAVLSAASGGGQWVLCPFDAREVFGEARPLVVATVNGHDVRTRLASYGGKTYLGLVKPLREAAGIDAGDLLDIALTRDESPREVVVPEELQAALDGAPDAAAVYEGLSFTHRKEYAVWVASATQESTRERRAAKAVEMLRAGTKHP
ncbi:MAG: hypothetical protein QOG52_607 [Frankiaceae bacterium]|nr:hypothetical protein [Frankiaceae bacterium]